MERSDMLCYIVIALKNTLGLSELLVNFVKKNTQRI